MTKSVWVVLLISLFLFVETYAFDVIPRGSALDCSNSTEPNPDNLNLYISPTVNNNGNTTEDVLVNWACNSTLPAGFTNYVDLLYAQPSSYVELYASNGTPSIIMSNVAGTVPAGLADFNTRTAFMLPDLVPPTTPRHFRIYDVNNGGLLFERPSVSTQNEVQIKCNYATEQYFQGGSSSLNGTIHEVAFAGDLGTPTTYPQTINNLTPITYDPALDDLTACDYYTLSWCGDGVVNTNPGDFDNTLVVEECDPGTEAGGIPVGVPAGQTCSDTCTLSAPQPYCTVDSPTITVGSSINPSTAFDSDDITFTCGSINNTNGSIRVRRNGSIFSTTALPTGNGSVTVFAASTVVGDTWEVECLDSGGSLLGYASIGGTCERSITIINDLDPSCEAGFSVSPSSAFSQAYAISAGSLINATCQFTNYQTATPPDGINLITPTSNIPLTPLNAVITPPNSVLSHTGVSALTAPGQYSVVCSWTGAASCTHDFWVTDPQITKYQSTGANFVPPTYNITNVQDGVAGNFMPLNGGTRIYYRLDLQNFGGGFTGVVGDYMPNIAGFDYCYLDLTRTSPQVYEINPTGGQYASGDLVLWGIPDAGSLGSYQIVYFCDYPLSTTAYQVFNTGSVWINDHLNGGIIRTPDVISNVVAAQYLPIPSVQLNKYQGTGWSILSDFAGVGIDNQQGTIDPGVMDITGLTGIAYRLHIFNNGVSLDNIEVSDVFPAGLTDCNIENVITTHTGTHTTFTSFPVPTSNPLWTGANFLNGDELTIIVTCDVPVISATYSNTFSVDVSVGGSNTQFVSNTVIADRQPTVLFIDKLQNNVSLGTPATGQFTSGALTYFSGNIFSFELNYGNNSLGPITDVQLIDTFPTGFVLQASSLTGISFSCDGGSPVFFPAQVSQCTWNLGTLNAGETGVIYLTGMMTLDDPGFYFNTGAMYTSGILIDESPVQQIPNLILGVPDLDIQKRQVTAINTGFTGTSCNPLNCDPTVLPITTQNNYYMQYTITVTNNGSGAASDVQIADTLPQGFIPISSAPSYSGTVGGICNNYVGPSVSGHFSFVCDANTVLPPGGSIEIIVEGQVTTNAAGIGGSGNITLYANTASVITTTTGANCDVHIPGTPNCASNTVIATIAGNPFLNIEKYFWEASAEPGDIVHFSIEYSNVGSAPAQNVTITDILPNGLNYISHLPIPPTFANNVFTISGDLQVSAISGVINVTAQVDTGFAGTGLTNVAQICASNVVGCPQDDAFLPIVLTTGFDIVKSAQVSGAATTGVTVGSILTYVLDFVNNGNSVLSFFEITDFLPPTVTYQNGSAQASIGGGAFQLANPNQSGGTLIWSCSNGSSVSLPNPCNLNPGETGQIIFDVLVN